MQFFLIRTLGKSSHFYLVYYLVYRHLKIEQRQIVPSGSAFMHNPTPGTDPERSCKICFTFLMVFTLPYCSVPYTGILHMPTDL